MKLTKFVTPVAVVTALTLAQSAQAQRRGGGGGGHGGGGGRSAGPSGAAPRGTAGARVGPSRGTAVPRGGGAPYRGFGYGGYPGYRGYRYGGYGGYGYRGYGYRGSGYGGYGGGYGFYRPYYSFRPRIWLGFGLWAGYPVAFPDWSYSYAYPYNYAYHYLYSSPYPDPAPDPNSLTVAPPAPESGPAPTQGGMSFDVTPANAGLYIDGAYVGFVGSFSPTSPPLTLAPGRHRVEVRSPGMQTIAFDVDVTPGRIIPYQGTMQPVQPR